ncbi:transcriptional adapter ADA2b isoform X4 [Cucumis sativus]|uniref:transcriptional adapter ADA2b isoform X4 n=1 Tax=Cucumis sativus TaxID=3659 RepID=UPI0012F4BD6E|nr:transcriptional adapter ADA2b isoform X4 [Cucumis sativus]
MGRSRGNFQSDEDPTQRSRRKKNSSSGDNLESTTPGQGTTEGKKALYHCNYCIKDITGKIRIKCAMCPDFDLCIECFSVGAELTPHKSNHPYRVMDNLSFPLICPDWNADDEILLLEGIEMYGFWNWAEVAEHVGTKSKEQCIEHYSSVYMNSPYFPLPDMSHVVGKNRKELLAMAKGHGEDKKGFSMLGELNLKAESPFSPSRVKVEDTHKVDPSGRLSSSSTSDSQTDRIFKGKKPNIQANKGPSLLELSGYNEKRQEFDPEYDNEAEQLLAEMEFKDADGEDERELKMRVLRIYSKRLDERKRRKDFILQRNLLYPSSFEKELSAEERAICRQYDVFMRFHSKEEHEELLQTIVAEHRTLKRIQDLKRGGAVSVHLMHINLRITMQEARLAGYRTPAEAEIFLDKKRKRESEEADRRVKDGNLTGPGSQGNSIMFIPSESAGKDSNSRPAVQALSGSVNDFDMLGFNGADFLSEAEKRLCSEIRLTPPLYLRMEEVLSVEIFNGNVTKKSDAHHLFKIDPSKIDRIYEMLIKKGIAQS